MFTRPASRQIPPVALVPELKAQKVEDHVTGEKGWPNFVIRQHLRDGLGLEHADSAERDRIEHVANERTQLALEPRGEGDAEAVLLAIDHLGGQIPLRQLAENPLALAARHLEAIRQIQREIDQAVVQEG